jgi:hypothetical protein
MKQENAPRELSEREITNYLKKLSCLSYTKERQEIIRDLGIILKFKRIRNYARQRRRKLKTIKGVEVLLKKMLGNAEGN